MNSQFASHFGGTDWPLVVEQTASLWNETQTELVYFEDLPRFLSDEQYAVWSIPDTPEPGRPRGGGGGYRRNVILPSQDPDKQVSLDDETIAILLGAMQFYE